MNNINLAYFEADAAYHLDQFQPVQLVDEAREAQGRQGLDKYDTTFDHFFYDYVGDIKDSREAPLALREHGDMLINYPNRMYLGFTQSGKLLLVRSSSEVSREQPEAYYIVTANLQTGEVVPWYVTNMLERTNSLMELKFARQPKATSEEMGHLIVSAGKVELTLPGGQFERVPNLDSQFFTLLERRQRWLQAEAMARLLTYMAALGVRETLPAQLIH